MALGRYFRSRALALVVVSALAFGILAQTPAPVPPAPNPFPPTIFDQGNCAGKDTCSDCTGASGCIWCIINSNRTFEGARICLKGDIQGASSPYNAKTCNDFYFNQCNVSDHWAGSSLNYVWMIVLLIFLILVCIVGIGFILMFTLKHCKKFCKKCDCSCDCCRCGRIIDESSVKTAEKSSYQAMPSGPNINDLAQGKRGPVVSVAPPVAAPPSSSSAASRNAPLVMPEDIDKSVLPPGFEKEPPPPVFVKGGTEDQYKDFMVARLKYETWENQLLLYYRRHPDWAAAHSKKT